MMRNRLILVLFLGLGLAVKVWAQQPYAIVQAKAADIYSSPDEGATRLTQALYGEIADILQNAPGGWSRVSLYWQKYSNGGQIVPILGWTRTTNLSIPVKRTRDDYTRNTAILIESGKGFRVPVYRRSGTRLDFLDSYPEGSLLPVIRRSDDETSVLLADGSEGVISSSEMRMLSESLSYPEFAKLFLSTATKYLRYPVLEGGMGPEGIDGGGLIHLAARIGGRLLPRDEVGIGESLRGKDLASLVPGDLVVLQHAFTGLLSSGISLGEGQVLGATSSRVEKLDLTSNRDWLVTSCRGFSDARDFGFVFVDEETGTETPDLGEEVELALDRVALDRDSDPTERDLPENGEEADQGETGSLVFDLIEYPDPGLVTESNEKEGQDFGVDLSWIDRSPGESDPGEEAYQLDTSERALEERATIDDRPRLGEDRVEGVEELDRPSGPAMYSIHLGSMLSLENALKLLDAVKSVSLPVFVTINETPQGQFFALYAGWYPESASAREAHERNLLIKSRVPGAQVRSLSRSLFPWSGGARYYSAQLMSLKSPRVALETMRDLARVGLGPVMRYYPLDDGKFWSIIHCSLGTDRGQVAARVRELRARTRWEPIEATFP